MTRCRRRWRRIVCRLVGHDPITLTSYDVEQVRTGTGCRRCSMGSIETYRGRYPMPRSR